MPGLTTSLCLSCYSHLTARMGENPKLERAIAWIGYILAFVALTMLSVIAVRTILRK